MSKIIFDPTQRMFGVVTDSVRRAISEKFGPAVAMRDKYDAEYEAWRKKPYKMDTIDDYGAWRHNPGRQDGFVYGDEGGNITHNVPPPMPITTYEGYDPKLDGRLSPSDLERLDSPSKSKTSRRNLVRYARGKAIASAKAAVERIQRRRDRDKSPMDAEEELNEAKTVLADLKAKRGTRRSREVMLRAYEDAVRREKDKGRGSRSFSTDYDFFSEIQ